RAWWASRRRSPRARGRTRSGPTVLRAIRAAGLHRAREDALGPLVATGPPGWCRVQPQAAALRLRLLPGLDDQGAGPEARRGGGGAGGGRASRRWAGHATGAGGGAEAQGYVLGRVDCRDALSPGLSRRRSARPELSATDLAALVERQYTTRVVWVRSRSMWM